MTSVCKLLFDLCFFYALSGYYFHIFTGGYPSAWGVPVLVVSAAVHFALTRQGGRTKYVTLLCCALPGLLPLIGFLAPIPGLTVWQLVQFVPAWAFFGFSILSGRVYMQRRDFEEHFGFTGKLFGLAAFGLVAFSRLGGAITGAVPYLIIYLLSGVCLMRVLRDDGELAAGRNVAVMLFLLLGSAALALLQAPKLLLGAVGFVYQNIIVNVLLGVAMALGMAVYGIFRAIGWLFSFFEPAGHEAQIDTGWSAQEIFGEEAGAVLRGTPAWLETAAAVFLALAVAFVVFLIMRKLLGNRREEALAKPYSEVQESLRNRGQGKKNGLIRPKDPRLAVRWYYRKYLKDGLSKGAELSPSDTSQSVLRKLAPFFPGAEAGRLRAVYIAARYRYASEPQRADADEAAELWRKLR